MEEGLAEQTKNRKSEQTESYTTLLFSSKTKVTSPNIPVKK